MINTKFCSRCETEKPFTEFHKNKARPDGIAVNCKPCKNAQTHERVPAYRTRRREVIAKFRKECPSRETEYQRRASWMKHYGITREQYDQMLLSQNGRCAMCKGLEPGNPRYQVFPVDHDHKTGKVRGLLCHSCNSVLGYAKDNIEILQSAIEYLKRTV